MLQKVAPLVVSFRWEQYSVQSRDRWKLSSGARYWMVTTFDTLNMHAVCTIRRVRRYSQLYSFSVPITSKHLSYIDSMAVFRWSCNSNEKGSTIHKRNRNLPLIPILLQHHHHRLAYSNPTPPPAQYSIIRQHSICHHDQNLQQLPNPFQKRYIPHSSHSQTRAVWASYPSFISSIWIYPRELNWRRWTSRIIEGREASMDLSNHVEWWLLYTGVESMTWHDMTSRDEIIHIL